MDSTKGGNPQPGNRWIREADAYLKVAVNSAGDDRRFDNALIRDLLALAAESYWIGLFRNRGRVPLAHTLGAMAREASAFVRVPGDLLKGLDRMDVSQNLCALEPGKRPLPTNEDITRMTAVVQTVRAIVTAPPENDIPH